MRSDEFQLPGRSYSVLDTQNYLEYIIKMHETLKAILPVYVYINRVNNLLLFKIKMEKNGKMYQVYK